MGFPDESGIIRDGHVSGWDIRWGPLGICMGPKG